MQAKTKSGTGKHSGTKPTLPEMIALTGIRREGFEFMLRYLRQCQQPRIIETGCARKEADFSGDGASTLIFDAIAEELNGSVLSVDINPEAVAEAQHQVGPRTTVHCGDSVAWLARARRKVDLLYLDSFDFELATLWASMSHHMQELAAGFHLLKPGALVAVDDNVTSLFGSIGKGAVVGQFFARIGIPQVFDGYQRIWQVPGGSHAATETRIIP